MVKGVSKPSNYHKQTPEAQNPGAFCQDSTDYKDRAVCSVFVHTLTDTWSKPQCHAAEFINSFLDLWLGSLDLYLTQFSSPSPQMSNLTMWLVISAPLLLKNLNCVSSK